jgi:chorismate dehydratase
MLHRCDAALVIGDPALFYDHAASGAIKTDLGQAWTAWTGLPFVWAFWAGRPGVLPSEAVPALLDARDHGVAASDQIAEVYCGPERAELGRAYLRENISYVLGEREQAGLRRYYELAAKHGLVDAALAPAFYHR